MRRTKRGHVPPAGSLLAGREPGGMGNEPPPVPKGGESEDGEGRKRRRKEEDGGGQIPAQTFEIAEKIEHRKIDTESKEGNDAESTDSDEDSNGVNES